MNLPELEDYQHLFLNDVPLIDVRAPVEFLQGAFPAASNLPLMNDSEREAVGIRYKEQGQDKAIDLGHELVSGTVKEERLKQWAAFAEQHPEGALYCFRGGMRSKITQQWIYEASGNIYPRIKGGYKAMRRYLLAELENTGSHMRYAILCGRTGTGKTLLLKQLVNKIDLEGIYHHRGSAFGRRAVQQPCQINVENQVAIELIKHRANRRTHLVLEDEAMSIGSRRLPDQIGQAIRTSPLVMLEADIETRIDNVFDEYIHKDLAEYQSIYGEEEGFNAWADNLLASLDRIQKRLGGVRHKELKNIMQRAIRQQQQNQDAATHREWIASLLADYYDPMYDYQLSKKSDRLVFNGEKEAVLQFISEQSVAN